MYTHEIVATLTIMNKLLPQISSCPFVIHSSLSPPNPRQSHWSLFCHYSFHFFVILCKWKQTVCTLFCCCLASFTLIILRFVMLLGTCISVAYFILLLSGILFVDLLQLVYPVTCWWRFGLFPVFGYYRQAFYEHLYRYTLSFSLANTQEWNVW